MMSVSTLLPSVTKTSGQTPAIHPPWNKARIGPMDLGDGRRERVRERKEEGVGSMFERGEAEKREDSGGGRGGRAEMETWERSYRGAVTNNGMRNVGGGGSIRPEHRGELPGLSSSGRSFGPDGSMVINGSYFQTSLDANKPPPVKQKQSETLSLISLARRLQGPARVGDEQWSDGKSLNRREEKSRKMYGSIGDMSVSASVSATGEEERRWDLEDTSSEGWWRRKKGFYDSESEIRRDGKESPSDFSPSDASSPASSVTTGHDRTESETETEKHESDSGTEKEERPNRKEMGSRRHDEEAEGSESESEDEGNELSSVGNNSKSKSGRNKSRCDSANLKTGSMSRWRGRSSRNNSSNSKSSRYSDTTVSSSRPRTARGSFSSHETIEEESEEESEVDEESGGEEEEEEDEERESAKSQKSSSRRRVSGRTQSDISSGMINNSDDLGPIMEDAEEEEEEEAKSRDHVGERKQNKKEGDRKIESAD